MANSEHVAKLQEGVEAWNLWREQNPDIQPDLSETDLSRVNLGETDFCGADTTEAFDAQVVKYLGHMPNIRPDFRKMNLSGANLSGANLSRADLREAELVAVNFRRAELIGAILHEVDLVRADLGGADLSGVDLVRANLYEVDLVRADLRMANLHKANFRWADLSGVILDGTNLDGANIADATFHRTIFANVNLTDVKGLDSCEHYGPSTIDHRTLERSGPLPLSFLRGCGLPNTIIHSLPSLNQYYSCFISYSSKDEAFTQRLHADLQDKGVRCWFAPEDMKIGDKIWDTIDKAIQLRDKLLLILSKDAIDSDWVEDEVTKAYAEERRRKQTILFPIRLDDVVMETGESWAVKLRDGRNIGDFCNWKNHNEYQKGLERLLRDLKIEKGK